MKRGMMRRSSSIDGTRADSGSPAFPRNRPYSSSHDQADEMNAEALLAGTTPVGSLTPAMSPSEDPHNVDVREILFESIPEPYCEVSDFQRVRIDEVESSDPDSTEACRKLKKSLALRKKWMSQHPVPPQDLVVEFDGECSGTGSVDPGTPLRKKKEGDVVKPHDYRRRFVPGYDVFARTLPAKYEKAVKFVMVDGVYTVLLSTGAEQEQPGGPNAVITSPRIDVNDNLFPVLSFAEFLDDFKYVSSTIDNNYGVMF
jgi:hypothetical protein